MPNDPTLWKVWRCRKTVHAQPCWHGRCRCGWATAFDFSEGEVQQFLEHHECSLARSPAAASQSPRPERGGPD